METLSITCCVLEKYFDKSILHFNFSKDIKIKIFLCIEYTTVKDIFCWYFEEKDFEYREGQEQCCFSFGEKRFSLAGATNVASDISALTCTLLDYVRDYTDENKEVAVPLKHIKITKTSINNLAENIVDLLEG